MNPTPYLSVVAGSRNDDHGGNLLHRMQIFIEGMCAGCEVYNIDAELLLVEWNPPPDRPRLREALHWPASTRCSVRIIEVPFEVHARFGTGTALPMHQMIAKNVGVRRARGEYVLATNIDIMLSEAVWERLARRSLRPDQLYRVDRHDVSVDVPEGRPLAEQLAFCRDTVFWKHAFDASRHSRDGVTARIWRPLWQLVAAAALSPLGFLPPLREPTRRARRSLSLVRRFGRLHVNACGDFTMLHRDAWHALGGYWEFTGFPMHIDSLLCYAAKFSGISEAVLPPPACAYHLDHGKGTGYREYARDDFWKAQQAKGIDHLTMDDYIARIEQIWRGERLTAPTQDAWGLADVALIEQTLP